MLRSLPGTATLLSQGLTRSRWQLFMPVATLDQAFMRPVATLFWQQYLAGFHAAPFQLAACEAGGVPVACALAGVARSRYNGAGQCVHRAQAPEGVRAAELARRRCPPDLPVLLVDDVVGAGRTLRRHAAAVAWVWSSALMGAWCIIAGNPKYPPPLKLEFGEKPPIVVDTLLRPDDIAWRYEGYVAKYGKHPRFEGVMR